MTYKFIVLGISKYAYSLSVAMCSRRITMIGGPEMVKEHDLRFEVVHGYSIQRGS